MNVSANEEKKKKTTTAMDVGVDWIGVAVSWVVACVCLATVWVVVHAADSLVMGP